MLSMQLLGLFAQRLPDNAYALVSNVCDPLGTTSHAVNVGVCNVQVLWMDQTWKVPQKLKRQLPGHITDLMTQMT